VLTVTRLLPDPTFYPTPALAGQAPPESLAYVALLASGENGKTDALGVVDTDPNSPSYSRLVGQSIFRTREMNYTISAGMRAAHTCALGTECACGAALSRGAWHELVAHPRRRHQSPIPATRRW
jgi:hypothetical protein